MFERFTERARQVVVLAQAEARALGHNYIGTEHLLLGLLRERDGIAARVLESFDVTLEATRAQVAEIIGQGADAPAGQIPFTPRAKKVLEHALREAVAMKHGFIGTEHLLLGLTQERDGVAARILLDLGTDGKQLRTRIAEVLSGRPPTAQELGEMRAPVPPASISVLAGAPPTPWLLALGLAAAAFPLGLLVGWLIWG